MEIKHTDGQTDMASVNTFILRTSYNEHTTKMFLLFKHIYNVPSGIL
jgi:hypothetical protein